MQIKDFISTYNGIAYVFDKQTCNYIYTIKNKKMKDIIKTQNIEGIFAISNGYVIIEIGNLVEYGG